MNLNFLFKSYDHLRYENGQHVSGPHGGANRAVKVEPNINGGEGYTVTLYNLDGNHPVWQNNIQMAPKPMKIVQQSTDKVVLRGFGYDALGSSFSDYGLTIFITNNSVAKCILHMHDRGVDIEYLKSETVNETYEQSEENRKDLQDIQIFLHKWMHEMPLISKIGIAQETDVYNNKGCYAYNDDDYETAIKYFNKALEIMPINDDALKNLINCYRVTNNHKKKNEIQERLELINKIKK